MQIKMITGRRASGKTMKLRAIQALMKNRGHNLQLLVGTELRDAQALVRSVAREIEQGHKTVLADDCSADQLKAVREWSRGLQAIQHHGDVVIPW